MTKLLQRIKRPGAIPAVITMLALVAGMLSGQSFAAGGHHVGGGHSGRHSVAHHGSGGKAHAVPVRPVAPHFNEVSPRPQTSSMGQGSFATHQSSSATPQPKAIPSTKIAVPAKEIKATVPYKRPSGATTAAQRESVQGKPCVKCGATTDRQVAGHKEALVKEHYETGTIDKQRMRSNDAVQPECLTCSAREGAEMSRYSRQMKKELGQ